MQPWSCVCMYTPNMHAVPSFLPDQRKPPLGGHFDHRVLLSPLLLVLIFFELLNASWSNRDGEKYSCLHLAMCCYIWCFVFYFTLLLHDVCELWISPTPTRLWMPFKPGVVKHTIFMYISCWYVMYVGAKIKNDFIQRCLLVCNLILTTSFSFLLFCCSAVCLDNCKHGACSLQGQCCDDQCLGGCSEPGNASSCVACRNLQHGNTCVEKCPPGYYVFKGWRCISFSFCQVGKNWDS